MAPLRMRNRESQVEHQLHRLLRGVRQQGAGEAFDARTELAAEAAGA